MAVRCEWMTFFYCKQRDLTKPDPQKNCLSRCIMAQAKDIFE